MDLTLPPRWPSEARFEAMDLLPCALFTLVDLTEDDLEQVRQACEAACIEAGSEPNSSVRIASQPRFIDQPLRAVFDHHVEWRARDAPLEFDPKLFIVVVDADWQQKGVLIVTLDDEEEEGGNVDSFFTRAEDAGHIIGNIQIGNMGWDELKELYGLETGDENDGDDGGDGDDDDNDAGSDARHGDRDEAGASHHPGPDSDHHDLGGPPPPKASSAMGFYIPIYIHSQLQADEVLQELEPMIRHKTPDDYACRIQDSLTPSPAAASHSAASHDLVAQAAALHPLRCAKNQWLQQKMFILVDTADPVENGMLMVRLDWAGFTNDEVPSRSSSSSSKTDLVAKGAALAEALDFNSCTIRLRYNCQYGLQNPFLTIAHGDAKWPSETARQRPKFLVCQYNTPDAEWGFGVDLLYAGVPYQQEYSQEQLVLDQELIVREKYNGTAKNFDEAVLKFPMVCRENRFVENFDTRYFICIDRLDVAEAGVLLVRRIWDGNVWRRTDQELMELDVVGVRSARVPVKNALKILEKGRGGNVEGMSPELVEFFDGSN